MSSNTVRVPISAWLRKAIENEGGQVKATLPPYECIPCIVTTDRAVWDHHTKIYNEAIYNSPRFLSPIIYLATVPVDRETYVHTRFVPASQVSEILALVKRALDGSFSKDKEDIQEPEKKPETGPRPEQLRMEILAGIPALGAAQVCVLREVLGLDFSTTSSDLILCIQKLTRGVLSPKRSFADLKHVHYLVTSWTK